MKLKTTRSYSSHLMGKPNFLANPKLLCKYFSQPRDEANKVHIFYFKMFLKYVLKYIFRKMFVVQCVRLFATPCTAARQDSLSFTISQSLLKLMSIESVMPSNHLILCSPLLLLLQSFTASGSFQMSIPFFFSFALASLLFSPICKASSDNHFAFLHFFSLGMLLMTASCTMSQTSAHSSSGTLSIRSKGFNLCHP